MAGPDPLLRHAIRPPSFDPGKVHRERLVDAIHANVPRKLIVIAAPPGYGKTTLLADFTNHTDLPLCWVRLTEADTDVMRLVQVLNASLARRFRRLRRKVNLDSLAGTEPGGVARVFAEQIDENISEAFGIIFDDIHLVTKAQPVMTFLDSFLEVLPEQVTVLVAGREVPEISLAKLLAEDDLMGLGPHDLAFDQKEIKLLAQEQFGRELGLEEADRLLEETRGWVTGILLSGKLGGLPGVDWISAPRPMVYEYLASVVLNRQPDDIRRFMLDASVLPIMTAESCDTVLDISESERFLRTLHTEGLFVSATDETPKVYQFHPQFREFLAEVLTQSDIKRLARLRNKAAKYLEIQGLLDEAVQLYLEAGNGSRAASLAEKNARKMYVTGRVETLVSWAEGLQEAGARSPRVLLYLGTVYCDQGKLDLARSSLERAQTHINEKSPKGLQAHAACVRGLIDYKAGDYQETIQAADQAEVLVASRGEAWLKAMASRLKSLALASDGGDLGLAEHHARKAVDVLGREGSHALAAALIDLSNVQAAKGDQVESHATSMRAHEILLRIGSPLSLVLSFNNLAIDAHLHGNYEQSLELFTEALKYSRLAGAPLREAGVLFGQADVFSDLRLAFQAAELYAEGLRIGTQIQNRDLIQYGCIQTSILHRRSGGGSLAMEWLKRSLDWSDDSWPTSIQLQMAAIEMMGSPSVARDRLVSILDSESGSNDVAEATLAHTFLAIAYWSEGNQAMAKDETEASLAWAGRHGTEQVMAAELLTYPELLDAAQRWNHDNPVMSVVRHRVETMRAIASKYEDVSEEASTGMGFQFFALGQLVVRREGKTVSGLTPFTREVLIFLIDRQRVERDVLLETFWPDVPPGRQISNLHTAIYAVRRAIGKDTIVSDGSVYSLNPEVSIEFDTRRFERVAAIAERLPPGDPRRFFALTDAINSYPGPFMPEFNSQWVTDRRRMLEMRFLDLSASYGNEALVRDQPSQAISAMRDALKIDPFRDDLNLNMLEALGRLGRRGEVVEHYQRYITLLAEELGLDPPTSVREAYDRALG